MDEVGIRELDSAGYPVLDALTFAAGSNLRAGSLANPRPFIAVDGRTYWLKAQAQDGLVAELVAGRIADTIGAGPLAVVIRVPVEALPEDGSAHHLAGIVVGVQDRPDTVNGKDFGQFLQAGGSFDPSLLDQSSRARTVAFQSWLGMGDAQVLVNVADGRVLSIDHGEWCGRADALTPEDPVPQPSLVVAGIPGVPTDAFRDGALFQPVLADIESVSDGAIAEAVSRVPQGEAWRADVPRRVKLARWLSERRDMVRGVVEAWVP